MLDKIIHCFDEAITSIAEDFNREIMPYCVVAFEIISMSVLVLAGIFGPLYISDHLPLGRDPSIWLFVAMFGMWGTAAILILVFQRAYMVCKLGDRK